MPPLSFTRAQWVRQATLTEADLAAVATCRGDYNRLGFAYQRAFVRLFHRFPAQQPLEVCDELLSFVALQLGLETTHLASYATRQSTVSDHQARIRDDLGLTPFGPEQIAVLKPFIFEAALRLEPSVALLASARNILREHRILFPAESALLRVVGEQKKRAQEQMATQILQQVPMAVTAALDDLLTVKAGEAVSALQRIKTNPAKPSARAMRTLLTKLTTIEATGILSLDLSWLHSNYQRAVLLRPGLLR